ncbi:MAG: ExbD/TolR family protein [Phycisphaeraceae bacterium]
MRANRAPASVRMNITPLIDVVFLLIVFFMLASSIASEQRVEMVVPELDDPQTRQFEDVEPLMVNVVPVAPEDRSENPLSIPGEAHEIRVGTLGRFAPDDLAGVTAALRAELRRHPEREVHLRADAAVWYDRVQPVLEAIREAGADKVHLVAGLPEPGDRTQP